MRLLDGRELLDATLERIGVHSQQLHLELDQVQAALAQLDPHTLLPKAVEEPGECTTP